jgi:hypothetical protein
MTTCRDVITYALRMTKVIRSGGTPTSSEASDGMVALQSFYDQLVANGMFGRLEDVYLEEDDTALEGKRYFVPTGITLTAATSVFEAEDGATRQPRDLALYESLTQAGVRSVQLYDRTAWVEMTGLELSDDAPLASRGAFALAAAFALSGGFAAMFGSAARIEPDTRMLGAKFMGGLSYKLGSTQDRRAAVYF